MSYNLTRHSVIRNKPQLDQIVKSKGSVIKFWTNKPKELQRNLHEAIRASAEFPEFKHYYEKIKPNYVIRARKNHVLVEKREELIVMKVEEDGVEVRPVHQPYVDQTKDDAENESLENLEAAGEILDKLKSELSTPRPETSDASTLVEILLVAKNAENDVTDLIFPRAQLSLDDKRKLNAWCIEHKVNFIDQEERGLTLTRREVDADLIWRDE